MLGSHCSVFSGYGFKSNEFSKTGVPVIKIGDLQNGKVDLTNDTSRISEDYLTNERTKKFILGEDDILIALTGATTGKVAVLRGFKEPMLLNQRVGKIVLKDDQIDQQFVQYIIQTKYYQKRIQDNILQSAQGNVSPGNLEEIKIPLPPLPEQKKIAHVLSKIQQAIETQEQIIKTTRELKKALMQKLFTEGLNGEPQKQTEIGPIPESWEVVKLGSYAKILNGYAFKSEDYVKKGVPLVRISNVSFGHLISKDDKYLPTSYINRYSEYSLKEGDLILSLTRPVTSGGMKYCFIEKKHLPALLNQRVGRFKIVDESLSKNYLYHLVFSKYFIGELEKLFGSSSQQPNVSPTQLVSFKVPFPKPQEQIDIAKTLDAINFKIQFAEQSISIMKSLFTSSLNQLMTGLIRVKDIEFKLENEKVS
jgi:type I restriction enzyme S subunit